MWTINLYLNNIKILVYFYLGWDGTKYPTFVGVWFGGVDGDKISHTSDAVRRVAGGNMGDECVSVKEHLGPLVGFDALMTFNDLMSYQVYEQYKKLAWLIAW